MSSKLFSTLILSILALLATSCGEQAAKTEEAGTGKTVGVSLKEESLNFPMDSVTSNSVVVYDENKSGARPVVIVVHEWWGLTEYPKMRAKQLAEMGYLAMALDLYGGGRTAGNPADAQGMAGPFYENPQLSFNRINAAIAKIKTMPQADTTQVAAIGYCFGGGILLNVARMGANLDGVVSFHGSLIGTPVKKELLKSKILVCHGATDPFVPEKELIAFKKSMDSVAADYSVKVYPNSMHAFTNPDATETGRKFNIPIAYNAAADSASWADMKAFFGNVFRK